MKIYVASSWRNKFHSWVVDRLRFHGHEVYDFKNPGVDKHAFSWKGVIPNYQQGEKVTAEEYRRALTHPRAAQGYAYDIGALKWCDAVVYVLPCGKSASWEFGFAMGEGKAGFVVMFEPDDPDLMFSEALIIGNEAEFDVIFTPKFKW